MATWITPKEGADRFRKLSAEIRRETINGLRRAQHGWRLKAFSLFSQRGLGQVFGERAVLGNERQRASTQQARVVIKRERVRDKGGDLFEAGLLLRGFAALVEGGGRTKAHEIKPTSGSVLAFKGAGGDDVFARSVRHPGSLIPKNPFVEDAARQSQEEFTRQMAIAAERAVKLAQLVA